MTSEVDSLISENQKLRSLIVLLVGEIERVEDVVSDWDDEPPYLEALFNTGRRARELLGKRLPETVKASP